MDTIMALMEVHLPLLKVLEERHFSGEAGYIELSAVSAISPPSLVWLFQYPFILSSSLMEKGGIAVHIISWPLLPLIVPHTV